MTNLHDRMLPNPRIEPAIARTPGGSTSGQATGPDSWKVFQIRLCFFIIITFFYLLFVLYRYHMHKYMYSCSTQYIMI